jgi:hypothetical protein
MHVIAPLNNGVHTPWLSLPSPAIFHQLTDGEIMQEEPTQNQPMLITRASRLVILGTLSFVELSVKLMAGAVIVASKGIKRILRKKPED